MPDEDRSSARAHRYSIAYIPGDGIGHEVLEVGRDVANVAADRFGFEIAWFPTDWGTERYRRTGSMMPPDGLDQLADVDAIYLGAVGHPDVPDHHTLWEMLLPIRRRFDQYVNLRPCREFDGLPSPMLPPAMGDVDVLIVRENTEGEYSDIGGRMFGGSDREFVVQQTVMTRIGVDRVLRYAFEKARSRSSRLASATKSNGLRFAMTYWDERLAEIARDYSDVQVDSYHVDILAAHFVQRLSTFDVVVASNLLGDILSDIAPAVCGGIGIAPSANLNPEGAYPSMFEPFHGSAPDIAGKGIANPIGAVWSGALMLESLGEQRASDAVVAAIENVFANDGPRTPDIGGSAGTADVARALCQDVAG